MKNYSIKYSSLLITPVTSLFPAGSARVKIFFGLGLALVLYIAYLFSEKEKMKLKMSVKLGTLVVYLARR